MSIYTTQLRWPVEYAQNQAGVSHDDFTVAYKILGLDEYPIFDETYRQTLNDKIIKHFYFREIGFETIGQFAWFMRTTMAENMPYFNQLYQSQNLITDPLTNRKYSWRETWELAQGVESASTDALTQSGNESLKTQDTEVTEHGRTNTTTTETEYGKTQTATENTDYGHTSSTDTDTDYGKTVNGTTTDTLGKENETTTQTTYGRTGASTSETTYGKSNTASETKGYGHTIDSENGGSDSVLDGGGSEKVIRSDTPMNELATGAVENGNYATDVTYTEREGTRASTTNYGGTNLTTHGGTDTASSTSTDSGKDKTTTSSNDGGTDTTTVTSVDSGGDTRTTATTEGGTDTVSSETTEGGRDTRTVNSSDGGSDTVETTFADGGTDTVTSNGDSTKTSTVERSQNATGTRDLDETGTREHTITGYEGVTAARLLDEWRNTFLNIDLQVIQSLDILFMGLWM